METFALDLAALQHQLFCLHEVFIFSNEHVCPVIRMPALYLRSWVHISAHRLAILTEVFTIFPSLYTEIRGSSVSIVSDYGLDDRVIGVRYLAEVRHFPCSLCPDQLWGLPSLLSSGYWGSFPRG
jgi:hypothetical protein